MFQNSLSLINKVASFKLHWEWLRLIPKYCLGMVQDTDTSPGPNTFKGLFQWFKSMDNHKLLEDGLIQLPLWNHHPLVFRSVIPLLSHILKRSKAEVWQPLWAASQYFQWSHFSHSFTWTSEPQPTATNTHCTGWNYYEQIFGNWTQSHLPIYSLQEISRSSGPGLQKMDEEEMEPWQK